MLSQEKLTTDFVLDREYEIKSYCLKRGIDYRFFCGIISAYIVCKKLDIPVSIKNLIKNIEHSKKESNNQENGYYIFDIYYAVNQIPNAICDFYFNFEKFKQTEYYNDYKQPLTEGLLSSIKFQSPISIDKILEYNNEGLYPILGYFYDGITNKQNDMFSMGHFSPLNGISDDKLNLVLNYGNIENYSPQINKENLSLIHI